MARASANLALKKDDFSVATEGPSSKKEGLPSLPSIVDNFNGWLREKRREFGWSYSTYFFCCPLSLLPFLLRHIPTYSLIYSFSSSSCLSPPPLGFGEMEKDEAETPIDINAFKVAMQKKVFKKRSGGTPKSRS